MDKKPHTQTPQQNEYHQGGNATAPYPVSRLAPAYDLVDMAKEISAADNMIHNRTHAKLEIIAEQIRSLQEQAKEVLEQAQDDQNLHHAKCNFVRKPGEIYHLYEKTDGERYFSMLSPEDWGSEPPHHYLNSYRLENDMSWTELSEIKNRDEDIVARYVQALGYQD